MEMESAPHARPKSALLLHHLSPSESFFAGHESTSWPFFKAGNPYCSILYAFPSILSVVSQPTQPSVMDTP